MPAFVRGVQGFFPLHYRTEGRDAGNVYDVEAVSGAPLGISNPHWFLTIKEASAGGLLIKEDGKGEPPPGKPYTSFQLRSAEIGRAHV